MQPAKHIFDAYKQLFFEGKVQSAYRGIMQFMMQLQARLKAEYPEFEMSGLYQGYMDMTYFSYTSKALSDMGLKIAIVFLHESFTFQVWLSARNRKLQEKFNNLLKRTGWNPAEFSKIGPGVDSIVENILVSKPDFEDPTRLAHQILADTSDFSKKIETFLTGKVDL